jgi:hypothetical protein
MGIPRGKIGDRFVAIFMGITLVLFAGSVVLNVFLVLRTASVQNAQAADQVRQRNAAISSCQQSNVSRTEDIDIWVAVLKLPPGATAAEKAVVARDLALVRKSYKLRDCAAAAG